MKARKEDSETRYFIDLDVRTRMVLDWGFDQRDKLVNSSTRESALPCTSARKSPALLGREPSYPDGLNGTFELAINVGAAQNVDAHFDRLTRLGARAVYCPRDEPWKMRSAMVADPEGNLIEIASDFWA